MAELFSEIVEIQNSANQITIKLDANGTRGDLGAAGHAGTLIVRDAAGNEVLRLDGGSASLRIGTTGNTGDLIVRDSNNREVLQFDGTSAVLRIGAAGNEGDIIVRNNAGTEVIHLDGGSASMRIGDAFQFDGTFAVLRIGAAGNEGDIIVRNATGAEVIHLDGGSGDIILRNADAAEQFDVSESVDATPGTLMILNHEGKLEPSSVPYDKKAVGVVAGAGNYQPGIVLDHKGGAAARVPISLLGKVSCKADAAYGPIEVGDLLTTSPTPGHAMKANDPQRAFGSVIGKALSPLAAGAGLVDVLVTLQ
jgi:hypothetical protein